MSIQRFEYYIVFLAALIFHSTFKGGSGTLKGEKIDTLHLVVDKKAVRLPYHQIPIGVMAITMRGDTLKTTGYPRNIA